jgi:hypothetical protein
LALALPGFAAGYMTWLCWRNDDDGKWIFAAFTAIFAIPAIAALFPRAQPKPEKPAETRFAPHWALMFATLALLAAALAGIIAGVVRWLG